MKYVAALMIVFALPLQAGAPVIQDVHATKSGNTWRFDVTILHDDSGWDHYADGWRILDMNGNPLGMRVLAHPHTNEQPFTRSLSGVSIPDGTTKVQIQARDLPGGWNPDTVTFTLP